MKRIIVEDTTERWDRKTERVTTKNRFVVYERYSFGEKVRRVLRFMGFGAMIGICIILVLGREAIWTVPYLAYSVMSISALLGAVLGYGISTLDFDSGTRDVHVKTLGSRAGAERFIKHLEKTK